MKILAWAGRMLLYAMLSPILLMAVAALIVLGRYPTGTQGELE